jgi:hypothetical protein
MVQASLLQDRSVVALSGADTRDFLQGIISNDMDRCTPGNAIYAGLLTPQGKILFDFFVVEREGAFLLDCAKDRAADLIKRLTLYRLRAKVEIAIRPDLIVAALWNGDAMALPPLAFADPRLAALGARLIGTRGEIGDAIAGVPAGDYAAHRLLLGVPDSADLPSDTVLALDAGFEELNGVNFKKGCYVGQEVTARMKHRATARKRFVIVESEDALPPAGTPIEAQDRELGIVASGKGKRALALARLDRLADAEIAGAAITAGGHKIVLRKPAWLAP